MGYGKFLGMGYKKFLGMGYEKFFRISVDIFALFSCERFLGKIPRSFHGFFAKLLPGTHHLSYNSFILHIICPTTHLSYTSFVLQSGQKFICPTHHKIYTYIYLLHSIYNEQVNIYLLSVKRHGVKKTAHYLTFKRPQQSPS